MQRFIFVRCYMSPFLPLSRFAFSSSTLSLTAHIISLNSANYTAWDFRRRCLDHLLTPLPSNERILRWQNEISYIDEVARQTPKNYQLWHHRRAIVERINQPGHELQHTVNNEYTSTYCTDGRPYYAHFLQDNRYIDRWCIATFHCTYVWYRYVFLCSMCVTTPRGMVE